MLRLINELNFIFYSNIQSSFLYEEEQVISLEILIKITRFTGSNKKNQFFEDTIKFFDFKMYSYSGSEDTKIP